MSKERTHPTDMTLIMAVDHELPTPRRETLQDHLAACDACRSRLRALEAAANAGLHRDSTPDRDVAIDVLRARVRQRMHELRGEWDRSLLFRARRMVGAVSPLARVAISAALVALTVLLLRSNRIGGVTGSLPAESLPIQLLTPGATTNVSVADLCSGSARTRRAVSLSVRDEVLRQYRMESVPASEYELDYLITPELGGVGDARNLWPERYDSTPWNAHVKDDLERLLSRRVCDGSIDLAIAQREIAGNWIEAYKKHFATDRPIRQRADVEDDDDEIQFESPRAIPGRGALISFAPVRISTSAELVADAAFSDLPARTIAWP